MPEAGDPSAGAEHESVQSTSSIAAAIHSETPRKRPVWDKATRTALPTTQDRARSAHSRRQGANPAGTRVMLACTPSPNWTNEHLALVTSFIAALVTNTRLNVVASGS